MTYDKAHIERCERIADAGILGKYYGCEENDVVCLTKTGHVGPVTLNERNNIEANFDYVVVGGDRFTNACVEWLTKQWNGPTRYITMRSSQLQLHSNVSPRMRLFKYPLTSALIEAVVYLLEKMK